MSSNTATLSASPYSGYQISGWSIGSCGTSSSCSTQTDSYKTVTVYFTQTPPAFYLSNFNVCDASSGGNCGSTVYGNGTGYYKVRVANSGGSGGTFNGHITINGGNWVGISSYISSGSYADFAPGVSSGTGTYTFGACQDNLVGCTGGTAVTFIAKPSLSGPSSVSSGGSATFTVSYDGAKTPTYSSYSCGTGGSFVSSSGATFTCSYVNNGGSAITASPSVAVSQGGISTTVSTSVTVNPVFYLSVSKSGSGTVTGTGISCGGTCATYLTQGTSVSLSASPSSGYVFGNWSGDCSGSGSCALTMNGARSVTANFTRVYSISASASSGGTVSCSGCGGSVSPGASVTVTATPSGGYYTSGWSGLGSGCSGNSCSITASADGSIGATFSAVTVSGTLSPSNTSAMTGQTSTFTPSRTGGTASGAVTFSGQSCGGGTISNINASTGAFTCGYSTSGTFTPSATVSQQGVSATPTASITISPFTDSFTITSPANGTTYNSGQTFTVSGTISTYYKGYQVRATLPSSEGLAQGTTPTSPQAFAFTTAPLTVPGTAGTYTVTVAVALDYLPGFGWGGNVKFLPSQTFTINVAAPASPQTVPKPRVSFSITPTAQCGTAKQADILKGATAGLCWKAVPDPIGTYCGTWDGKSVYIGRLWKQEGNTSYYVGTSGAAADTMSCVGLWDNTNNSWSQSMFCKYADQRQCSFSTSALGGTAYSSSPGSFPACPSGWHASGDGCGPDSASVGGGGGDVPSAIVQSVSCQPASGSSSGGFQGSLASNGSASSAALNVDRQFSIECWGKDGSGTKVTDIATDSVTAKVVGPDLTATTPTVQLLFGTTPPSGTTNTFYAGSSIKLTSTVTNGGTAGTGVAFKGSWQAYPSATTPTSVSQYTTLTNGLKDITALGTGGSQISTHTITGVTEGTFYLGFCPDSSGVVNELSETNNCSAPVTVVIKKLYIPNVSLYVSKDSTCGTGATAQTIAGTKVTLCWKVNAQ